jgi:hypothetical protein
MLVYITAAPPRDYQQHIAEFSAFARFHRGSEFFLHRGLEYAVTAALILALGRGDAGGDGGEPERYAAAALPGGAGRHGGGGVAGCRGSCRWTTTVTRWDRRRRRRARRPRSVSGAISLS